MYHNECYAVSFFLFTPLVVSYLLVEHLTNGNARVDLFICVEGSSNVASRAEGEEGGRGMRVDTILGSSKSKVAGFTSRI